MAKRIGGDKLKFNFRKKKYELQKAYYDGEHTALVAFELKTETVRYVLTVNLPGFDFPEDEFAMKAWGENKDIIEVVFNLGVFQDTGKRGSNGEHTVEFWKLSDKIRIADVPFMAVN